MSIFLSPQTVTSWLYCHHHCIIKGLISHKATMSFRPNSPVMGTTCQSSDRKKEKKNKQKILVRLQEKTCLEQQQHVWDIFDNLMIKMNKQWSHHMHARTHANSDVPMRGNMDSINPDCATDIGTDQIFFFFNLPFRPRKVNFALHS